MWLSLASAAPLAWDWSEGVHREYFVETEVQLPALTTVYAQLNTNARITGIHVSMVLDCTSERPVGQKGHELWCDIVDIGLVGTPLVADAGILAPVMVEMDEVLTDAAIQMQLRNDGRVVNVDLEGVARPNRRVSFNAEMFRLFLVRAIAGFDLRLPHDDVAEGAIWSQRDPLLFDTPHPRGSQGSGEIGWHVKSVADSGYVIEGAGRGMTAPATDAVAGMTNLYQMRVESVARFDPAGCLRQRTWAVEGLLTAGSVLNEGLSGVPYLQRGRLVLVEDPSFRPVIPESGETTATDAFGTLTQLPGGGSLLFQGTR